MDQYLIKEETLKGIADQVKVMSGNDNKLTTAEMINKLEESNETIKSIADKLGVLNEIKYLEGTLSVYKDDNVESLRGRAFYGYSNLISVYFHKCTSISGQTVFGECINLTNADFPNCSYIGSMAFISCYSLTNISFPNCTNICNNAFDSCSNLTNVNFPMCTSIGNNAFYGCTNLSILTLPSSSIATLSNTNAFANTPMSNSTYTGSFGSIYVPASLIEAYKTATNWSVYSSRITSIENLV